MVRTARILRRAVKSKKLNRSRAGSFAIIVLLSLFAAFSLLPILLSVLQALKPLEELYVYPPRFLVTNPTLGNFSLLFDLASSMAGVPFSRYLLNTVFITLAGTAGNVLICSLAAYPLAKHARLPGGKLLFEIVVAALMFNAMVADIVNYVIMAELKWLDTYLAVLVPAFASALGLFLMRQFMTQIPDSLLEAAKIDGAGEYRIFWMIVMPNVKPAWLTLSIFAFQALWNGTFTTYIYKEELKTLPYALSQIVTGGITRAGAGAAAGVAMMLVPVVFFMLSQSQVLETMASSGMKE